MKNKIKRLLQSFFYSFRGLRKVFREEQNFQIQVLFALLVIFLAICFQVSKTEWLFLIFSIFLVLIMETINSAVERVSDILKPRIDKYVKEIKDMTAGAVMLSSILAILVGLMVFLPYFLQIFINL